MSETSATLRDITLSAIEIERKLIEADGIIDQDIEDALKINNENMASKIDGYALLIRRLESAIDYHKQMMKDHSSCIDRLETTLEWMESNIKGASEALNKPIMNGNEFSIKISLNKPSVDILDEKAIEPDYIETKTSQVISKTKIKEALDIGIDVKGARLIQKKKVTLSLRKRQIED